MFYFFLVSNTGASARIVNSVVGSGIAVSVMSLPSPPLKEMVNVEPSVAVTLSRWFSEAKRLWSVYAMPSRWIRL